MFSDGLFTHCVVDLSRKLSSPVYGYLYDYQNEFSFNTLFGTCDKPLGVSHGDERISLFNSDSLNPKGLNAKDLEVSKIMVDIWYKFAASE